MQWAITLVCYLLCIVLHLSPICCHSTNSLLLVFSLDGFRWDYLDLMKSKQIATPNFDRFIAEGSKAEYLKPEYPSKTYPAHWSIATGLYAESHGLVQNKFWDPLYKEAFNFSIFDQVKDHKWYDNDGTVEPIWITNQRGAQTIFPRRSGVIYWPGGDAAFGKDDMRSEQYERYEYPLALNDTPRIKKVVSWFAEEENPINFAMVHLEGTDHTGHMTGADSDEVVQKIKEIDGQIGVLLAELERHQLDKKVNVILLSDHGMANIKEHIALNAYIDPSFYTAYGYSPMWQIVPNEGKDAEVRAALQKLAATNDKVSVYFDKNTPPGYHFSKHRRVLPIIVRVSEGVMLGHTLSEYNNTLGDHGYADSAAMRALLIARGPNFAAGGSCGPVNQVDVYPLMCHILGLHHCRPNNGSMEVIQHLLVNNGNEDGNAFLTLITFVTSVGFAATVSGVCCVAACRVYRISRYRRSLHRRRTPGDVQMNSVKMEAQKALLESDDEEI